MKKKVIIFLSGLLILPLVVPVINIIKRINGVGMESSWWHRELLYNIDFALPCINGILYSLSISTVPNKVIIGKDGWLYLGDEYNDSISYLRRGSTPEDVEVAKQIGNASTAWAEWLRGQGVQAYKIIVCPDKSLIYPEYLPDWVKANKETRLNALFTNVSKDIFINLEPLLLNSKKTATKLLYLKTDSHWSYVGSWFAYQAIASEIGSLNGAIKWLGFEQVSVQANDQIIAGDLLGLLRLKESVHEIIPSLKLTTDELIKMNFYDFHSGNLMQPNEYVSMCRDPLLIKSQNSLNQKKVLWIHDSYGDCLYPYMAATFSEILQAHFFYLGGVELKHLVQTFKPDYVFVSVVGRDCMTPPFREFPPTELDLKSTF
jgi:hypothetical protein